MQPDQRCLEIVRSVPDPERFRFEVHDDILADRGSQDHEAILILFLEMPEEGHPAGEVCLLHDAMDRLEAVEAFRNMLDLTGLLRGCRRLPGHGMPVVDHDHADGKDEYQGGDQKPHIQMQATKGLVAARGRQKTQGAVHCQDIARVDVNCFIGSGTVPV